jgi:hypothetical protein
LLRYQWDEYGNEKGQGDAANAPAEAEAEQSQYGSVAMHCGYGCAS